VRVVAAQPQANRAAGYPGSADQVLPANFPLFLAATFLICVSPGPNVMMVISFSLKEGAGQALRAVLGTTFASTLYLSVSVLGLIAVVTASQRAFALIRYAGAAYLVYLGVRMLRGAWRHKYAAAGQVVLRSRPFVQGLTTHLSNPKAIAYWTALLPQFVEPSRSVTRQVIILGAVAILFDFVILASYAALASWAREWLLGSRTAGWIDLVAGSFLIGAGTLLAFASNVST
jgi:homoserine/homoserine lactone efflux protein